MAKETEVPEAPEASDEREAIEETLETVETTEKTEDVEAPEAVEATEAAAQPLAEEAAAEETAEAIEVTEAPEVEAIEVAEEEKVVEAAEPAEPVEVIVEAPDLVEELPEEREVYYYGTGRRKTSTARVRLYPSKEPEIIVNDKLVDQHFSRSTDVMHLREPLQVTATEDMFRITVKVQGGGISGQAGAIRHGIARALTKANPELRLSLRKGGFLTRDPRVKERKKPGLKRARKAPQYTKR